MDEALLDFTESRQRSLFGKRAAPAPAAGDAEAPDPLFPSLDVEPPVAPRRERQLRRPSWDPRDRWRQLRPSQPLHAPPESDLPPQFRYEDLSVYEKSETMEPSQDRLLAWLLERFESGLQFKYSERPLRLSPDEAVRAQVFSPLQALDERLGGLGLSAGQPELLEQRRRLAERSEPATAPQTVSEPSRTTDSWEPEVEIEQETGQAQVLVVTVHEAKPPPKRRPRRPQEFGDMASTGSTIECDVNIREPRRPRVAQFGDAPSSCGSGRIEGKFPEAEDTV